MTKIGIDVVKVESYSTIPSLAVSNDSTKLPDVKLTTNKDINYNTFQDEIYCK